MSCLDLVRSTEGTGFSCLKPSIHGPLRRMSVIGSETLLRQLNWRYATKEFDPARKIDPTTWAALEEALILSPSSFGLQPWRFYVITDRETKGKLVSLSWGQRQLADASHVVVFAVKHPILAEDVRRHIERTAQVRGRSVEELAGFERVVNDFPGESARLARYQGVVITTGVHRFGKLHDQRRTAGRGYLPHGGA